jgi:hypothetical protein
MAAQQPLNPQMMETFPTDIRPTFTAMHAQGFITQQQFDVLITTITHHGISLTVFWNDVEGTMEDHILSTVQMTAQISKRNNYLPDITPTTMVKIEAILTFWAGLQTEDEVLGAVPGRQARIAA